MWLDRPATMVPAGPKVPVRGSQTSGGTGAIRVLPSGPRAYENPPVTRTRSSGRRVAAWAAREDRMGPVPVKVEVPGSQIHAESVVSMPA